MNVRKYPSAECKGDGHVQCDVCGTRTKALLVSYDFDTSTASWLCFECSGADEWPLYIEAAP